MRRILRLPLPKPTLLLLLLSVLGFGMAQAPRALLLTATAYTSAVRETDSTPYLTATGARTRVGVIAVSPDMLRSLPYGSRVRLEDMGENGRGAGRFNYLFRDRVFIVEDTMHPRKRERLDVWLPERSTAIRFGVRTVRVTVLQYGRG